MIVPYFKNKRYEEMHRLAEEFRKKIDSNFIENFSHDRKSQEYEKLNSLLGSSYSMLALMKLLLSGDFDANPSRELALFHAQNNGDVKLFVDAMSNFKASKATLAAMKIAYAESIFTGFMRELQSDILMAFVQCLAFNYRGAAIHLRCALEDLYRHLFYMHHPQEYKMLVNGTQDEISMKLGPRVFREYLSRVDYLQPFAHRSDIESAVEPTGEGNKSVKEDCNDDSGFLNSVEQKQLALHSVNESLYRDLSSAVHGATSDWFAATESAESLVFNQDRQKRLYSIFSRFNLLSISFLVAAHKDSIIKMAEYDRSIVFSGLPKDIRGNLRKLLNV